VGPRQFRRRNAAETSSNASVASTGQSSGHAEQETSRERNNSTSSQRSHGPSRMRLGRERRHRGRALGALRSGSGVSFVRPGPSLGNGVGSGWSSRSAVRTGRLRRSPVVHSRPIDLVVFQEPSWPIGQRKPGLGGGFALRCLQRLSGPDLATRRCPERDSRHTRGRSSPILSY
jgi:hypothetical protein